MTLAFLVELAWKSAVAAGLALAVVALLKQRSAAQQSLAAFLGVLALVALPLAAMLLPALAFDAPAPFAGAARLAPTLPQSGGLGSLTASAAPQPFDWSALLTFAYLTGAAMLLGGLVLALLRLWRIRSRAELLDEPAWLSALVAAQRRVGCKTGTALLVSPELDSPVSWGLLRPTIIVDSSAAGAVDQAEAIITHELAHVVRRDWLRLIIGRVAIAIFWFNPLVWMLVRQSHQLAEEAADDAVLCTRMPRSDYAQLLLNWVRHSQRSALLAANGVAPSRSSLSKRVDHVLAIGRARQPVRPGWSLAGLVLALSLNGVLAAATLSPASGPPAATDAQAGERAAAALERLGTPQARAVGRAIRLRDWDQRRADDATLFRDPAAIEPLVDALADDDPQVRVIAVWGLSEMRPPPAGEAAPSLQPLLADPSPAVRAQAARALAEFDSVAAAPRIADLLRDPDANVRANAAHALGDLQLPQSRPALEAARSDPDPAVRAKVGWALEQISDSERITRRVSG